MTFSAWEKFIPLREFFKIIHFRLSPNRSHTAASPKLNSTRAIIKDIYDRLKIKRLN